MPLLDSITDRLLSLMGLQLDFSDLHADRFSAISDALVLGVRPNPEDTVTLKDAGITHVVSCLEGDQRPRVTFLEQGFDTLFVPARDGMQHDLASSFPTFFEFADSVAPEGRLYVHCERGVSRSGTLATAFLMRSERLAFFDAYLRLRSRRAEVLPNIGFASQLQRFEHELLGAREGESSLTRYLHEVCNVPVEVEVLREALDQHEHDAPRALRQIFGGDIPRVVQGVRV